MKKRRKKVKKLRASKNTKCNFVKRRNKNKQFKTITILQRGNHLAW